MKEQRGGRWHEDVERGGSSKELMEMEKD